MKKENKYISGLIIIGIVLLKSLVEDKEFYAPVKNAINAYDQYFLLVIIFFICWGILSNLKLLKKPSADLVKIKTENDGYYSVLPFIIGFLIVILALVFYKAMSLSFILVLQWVIIGVLFIVSGILYDRSSYIRVKKEKLIINIDTNKQWIKLKNLKNVKITSDKIIITEISDRINYIDHLELDQDNIKKIERYLKKYGLFERLNIS